MGGEGRHRLSPGDTRSRGQREADLFAHRQPSSGTGEHSVWCDLILVEAGFRPLEARNVVLVITRSKVLLRVVATGFALTIHLQDIVQVRHVVPARAVELHVEVPLAASPEEHNHPGPERWCTVAKNRLYRVYPKECGRYSTSACAQLFQLITSLLPAHVQQASEESHLDDAVAWYERVDACSMLPYHLSEEVGLRELDSISYSLPHLSSSASVARLAAFHAEARQHPPTRRQARSALSLGSSCRGFRAPSDFFDDADMAMAPHLRQIYVVPSPSFWRLPKASSPSTPSHLLSHERWTPPRLRHDVSAEAASQSASSSTSTMQRQHALRRTPESPGTFFATTAPASRHQLHQSEKRNQQSARSSPAVGVGMSRREPSLTAGMPGLRPLTARAPPFLSYSSARFSWRGAQRPANLEYGPTTSG
ncbi:hypothetical protein, conserved [Leishmania donovani]|uniref:Uncharacterized protein n=1 Tax=Leishmania donovani TaxID=5661 RepID=A0A3S7WY45_LEIDO|nr:hypothetical protein, conserved [Leishmania donovani]AYU79129.1 hypothetical protein LdCL_240009600 [Leishmania donovani]TPP52187.1 hypothetical protein CGC21_15910 [Leishmania donovani]CBZ34436.1 hypothetical protein, conserved [Leishmania donovani]